MLVWEWISNLISLLTGHVIMYPCWNYSYKFSCTYVRSNYCSLLWNISSHYIVYSSNISVLDYGFEPNRRQAVITCATMSRKELMSAGLGLGWQIAWTWVNGALVWLNRLESTILFPECDRKRMTMTQKATRIYQQLTFYNIPLLIL